LITSRHTSLRDRAAAAAGRKDAKMKTVVMSEKWDKKAAKYTAGSLPFPYTSREVYEGSIRQPLGREFNADTSFR
jgi:U3 small nucleolar RNA-associated protein 14